jgi:hypothetical protein
MSRGRDRRREPLGDRIGDLRLEADGGPVAVESMSGEIALRATAALAVTARRCRATNLRAPLLEALSASTTSGTSGWTAPSPRPATADQLGQRRTWS